MKQSSVNNIFPCVAGEEEREYRGNSEGSPASSCHVFTCQSDFLHDELDELWRVLLLTLVSLWECYYSQRKVDISDTSYEAWKTLPPQLPQLFVTEREEMRLQPPRSLQSPQLTEPWWKQAETILSCCSLETLKIDYYGEAKMPGSW